MQTLLPRFPAVALLTALTAAVGLSTQSVAQTKIGGKLPIQPSQPTGHLGALGTYRTIEGVLYDGNGKVESNTLVVDVVDGKRLDKPIHILVKNTLIPAKVRCVLKGYELGEMIGRPPGEYALMKELGRDPSELAKRDAAVWRWRPFFVPLIATQPKGLEVSTKWGISAGEPVIDISSEETFSESLARVNQSLAESERKTFSTALAVATEYQLRDLLIPEDYLPKLDATRLRRILHAKKRIHGKTAREIIASAKRITALQKEREKELLQQDIDRTRQDLKDAGKTKEQMKRFAIEDSRFYFAEANSTKQLVVEVSVKNNTEHTVGTVDFDVVLASRGRTIPWLKTRTRQKVSGGIEPGEARKLTIIRHPTQRLPEELESRDDLGLSSSVTRIAGPRGETILTIAEFERTQKLLEHLEANLVKMSTKE